MKKTLLVILILFFAVCVADAKHKHKKKTQPTNGIESVTMHRTACFGRCPDYIVDINSNGTVTYTGIRFTADSGDYKKNIGAAETKKILDEFATYRVDTCQEVYDNRIPDAPGLVYTIKYANKTQEIHNAHFGPYFLKQMALDIDAISKVDDSWQRVTAK